MSSRRTPARPPLIGILLLAAAAAWGRERGVPVFSDECYVEFTWSGDGAVPISRSTAGTISL